MTPGERRRSEVVRRVRLAGRIVVRTARYVSRDAARLGWRDALALPVVTAGFVCLALVAPGKLSEPLAETPHGPVSVR